MKKSVLFSIAILCCFTTVLQSFKNEEYTKVLVEINPSLNLKGDLSLTLNGSKKTSRIEGNVARFLFETKIRGVSNFTLSNGDRNWETNAQLNGIGFIKVELQKSSITVQEAALIILKSDNEKLDIWIDNNPEGTTEVPKTVSPNDVHTIVWKRDGVTKCTKTVVLSPGAERIYSCNSKTGTIIEQ